MADMVTVQELENAKIDARTIGESVNENKIVTPRYGAPFKSMPMIAEEMQGILGTIIAGGVPANIVLDTSGKNQQEVNNGIESIADLLAISTLQNGNRQYVKSHTSGKFLGGGEFVYDASKSAENDGGFIYNGWVRQANKKIKKPEYWGCLGDGITSDRIKMAACLAALNDGDTLELEPSAIYYNDCANGYISNWKITKNNVRIIANGATFKRRPTSTLTADIDGNLAALEVNQCKGVRVIGNINLNGSEAYGDVVNSSAAVIASGEYVRGYKSSHGLYLYKADKFSCLDIYSENAVFNIFADRCIGLRIKGSCKSSGQVYPVVGSDYQLGSGIKAAYCTDYEIDLITDYAGYAGVEIEPETKRGHVKSVAYRPVFFGVIFHTGCTDATVDSVTEGAINGSGVRLGKGSQRITGKSVVKSCRDGLLLEPSNTDATESGDITECDVKVISRDCTRSSILMVTNTSGGSVRESNFHATSINDGTATNQPAFALTKAYNTSFSIGGKNLHRLLTVDKVYESEIDVRFSENVANTNFFTAGNTVDLKIRQGGVTYQLMRTAGCAIASSLNVSNTALPIVNLTSIDFRANQFILPTMQTSSSATLANGLWMDSSDANTIKRK